MGHVDDGMIDVKVIDDPLNSGCGSVRAIKTGKLPLMLIQRNGDTVDVVLNDYKYAPKITVCLFSLMKAMKTGWAIIEPRHLYLAIEGQDANQI